MKITYSAPNRSHHYPYAEAINRTGNLHAFISGFSRFSPRSKSISLGEKLKRHDLLQNLYLAALKFKAPFQITSLLTRASASWIDSHSYNWAKESDAFIYYRTQGYETTKRIHKEQLPTICVMEEVNSHVENMNQLMERAFLDLGAGKYKPQIPDFDLRLKSYDNADYILCPSEFVKNSFIKKGFSPDKIIKVNFGFRIQESNNLENSKIVKDKNSFRVLFVGQLHYRKGLRYALEAFKNLKHPKKEFIIVGPKTLETGIDDITIPDHVRFTGILKGAELEHEYRSADVFLLPSIEEGLALVQGEALTYGVPLIITSNTGGDDIISNGVEGFIVEPFNSKMIQDKLQEMADNPTMRESMSYSAHNTAITLGNWDNAAEKLLVELQNKIPKR